MATLDKDYWDNRHKKGDTPWEIGKISPPLKAYFDQITDKNINILIPGVGDAHEAEYLVAQGFSHISICDISPTAIAKVKNQLKEYPHLLYITNDFFKIDGKYDLIVEQTFFCALDPLLRNNYVNKIFDLMSKEGTLAGVFFASHFQHEGPPFGGDINEYKSLLSIKLHIHQIQMCYNSIPPRQGNELFIICKK